jgi:hypothetical protein
MEQRVTKVSLTVFCYEATDKAEEYKYPEPEKREGCPFASNDAE